MKIELNKDVWAGAMLAGIGAAALLVARDYRFGSALRMGPGFFPTVLSWILMPHSVSASRSSGLVPQGKKPPDSSFLCGP